MYEAFQVGKQVPKSVLSGLSMVKGDRVFATNANSGKALEIFIVMRNLLKKESKELKGPVTVIFQDFEVPFLVLKYNKMSFEAPLIDITEIDEEKNALTVYVIDEKNYILKSFRMLGLNHAIMHSLATGVKKFNQSYPTRYERIGTVNTVLPEIYSKYSIKDMCSGGVSQSFRTKMNENQVKDTKFFNHYTTTTGHNYESPLSGASKKVIDYLIKNRFHEDGVHDMSITHPDLTGWKVHVRKIYDSYGYYIAFNNEPFVECLLSETEDVNALQLFTFNTEGIPPAPYLLVNLHTWNFHYNYPALTWLADFERSLAWAILEGRR